MLCSWEGNRTYGTVPVYAFSSFYYVSQVNEVNGGDNVFVRCVCLSVFLLSVCAQRTGQSDQFKTVKTTDFKFDTHVPRGISDMN